MSKIERLNARVAKLLTEAVQEVLEVVKETVSEYQSKTARTQRENESLKRRLQELQEQITRDRKAASAICCLIPEEDEVAPNQDQDLGLSLRHNREPSLKELKAGLIPELEVKQESNQQESYDHVELQSECKSPQTTEHCNAPQEEGAHIVEEVISVNTSHRTDRDVSAVTSNSAYSSLSNTLGLNLAVIKREPEVTDCTSSEQPSLRGQYSGCVDLSCNSSRFSSVETHRQQVSAEPRGLHFSHSNHAVTRRLGFAKSNRATFDARKIRLDHLREEIHVCVVCGKSFSRIGNLRIHQRCHTGEKPYGCVQCGRRFSQAGDLKKHKRVHTGEKPYYCNQCGKSFSRGENLKRHQKIHIGEILQLQQVWREQQQ